MMDKARLKQGFVFKFFQHAVTGMMMGFIDSDFGGLLAQVYSCPKQ